VEDNLHPDSVVVAAGRPHEPGAPLNPPIVLTAPYRHDPEQNRYARHDVTATVAALEEVLGELDGGAALAFASGMAAMSAVVEGRPGGAIAVVPREAYSGSVSTFGAQEKLGRMTVRAVDIGNTAAVADALDGADLLWLEAVTNPLMTVPDIPALVAAAHEGGTLVGVDATFCTPLGVRPLELGADIVLHSATKYLAGHSDVLMGVLVTRSADLAAQLLDRRTLTGALPGALEAYLTLRGVRTLALRMERAQANAGELARRLSAHPRVTRVRYPGLPDDPGHAIAARDFAGFGAMIAFEVDGTAQDAERVCESVRLITHATSLGGVETLIERRARHAVDASFGTPETLLRLSVGIEHVEDLWTDLSRALT
jgi:cystathionine gamma-synthase